MKREDFRQSDKVEDYRGQGSRLPQAADRSTVPDRFAQASAADPVAWRQTGPGSGEIDLCNTFAR
jgi:predicted metalloprotease